MYGLRIIVILRQLWLECKMAKVVDPQILSILERHT